MKRPVFIAMLAGIGVVAASWFGDPVILFLIGVLGLLWVGLPAVVVGLGMIGFAWQRKRSRKPGFIVLGGVVGFAAFILAACLLNAVIEPLEFSAAKAYPARVAPMLEAYRQAHGNYPARLDQLPSKPWVPRMMRSMDDAGYSSNGDTYGFTIPASGFDLGPDTWNYDSRTKTWQFSD